MVDEVLESEDFALRNLPYLLSEVTVELFELEDIPANWPQMSGWSFLWLLIISVCRGAE